MESSRQNRSLSPVLFFAILTAASGVLALAIYILSGMYESLSELPNLLPGVLVLFTSIAIVHFTPFQKLKIASWVVGALAFICSIAKVVLETKENATDINVDLPQWTIIDGLIYGTPSACLHLIGLGLWTLVLGTIVLGTYSLFFTKITSRSEKGEVVFWSGFYGLAGFIIALALKTLAVLELLDLYNYVW